MHACTGVLSVLDPGLELLENVFCLFEAWVAVYYGGSDRLKLALPGQRWMDR